MNGKVQFDNQSGETGLFTSDPRNAAEVKEKSLKLRHPSAICSACKGELIERMTKCQLLFAERRISYDKLVVLVAEDDDRLREFFSLELKDNGFIPLMAKDGGEAMGIYKEAGNGIDAIISDIRMPRADGEQLARLNAETHRKPFIVHTSDVNHDLALRLVDLGVEHFVLKTADTKPLFRVVKSVVFRKRHDIPTRIYCKSYGNSGTLTVGTKWDELTFAISWLKGRLRRLMPVGDLNVFMRYAEELLLNAYEHGNLGVTLGEKTELIESGKYNDELERREKDCDLKICLKFNVLGGQISISIKDEGPGFDYDKFLNMSRDSVTTNLLKPNGRGIYMASKHLDTLKYNESGNEVFAIGHLGANSDTHFR